MGLLARAARAVGRRLGLDVRRLVDDRILHKTYRVVEGAVRRTDYDDAWLLALGHDAEVVFDVGCNLGQSSLLLLHGERVRRILLVDANADALAVAAENLVRNGLADRALFVSAFVSDVADESVRFYTLGSGGAGSMHAGHAASASAAGASRWTPTTTVDALAERYDLRPDLVKIDVEGAEALVLAGASETTRGRRTRFLVEMHHTPELSMAENAAKVLDWCGEVAYTAWYLKEKSALESADPIAGRGRCHLLLLPEEMPFPEYLRPLEQGAEPAEVDLELVSRSTPDEDRAPSGD